jgi:flagellar motility protein MotE (MotC chaperone)
MLALLFGTLTQAKDLVDCNAVFEQRKGEILRELDRLDEEQQAFELYKEAQRALIDKKEKKLSQKLAEVNATLQKVTATKKEIVDLYEKNKKLLEEIKKAKDDKITASYLKMKDSKAAAILDAMPQPEAARILFNLTPKKIAKVMAKMDPDIASKVTELLIKGPPFDSNLTK